MRPYSIYEYGLWKNQPMLYLPDTGTSLNGGGFGPTNWTNSGAPTVVSHPQPASTDFVTQHRRTRITSGATTTNQELGIHLPNNDQLCFWRGNAANLGGFYVDVKFKVQAIPATSVRLFCGLSSLNTAVCVTDTPGGSAIGLWCDTGDAGNLTLLRSDGTREKITLLRNGGNVTETLATGKAYRFKLWALPNGNQIGYQLLNLTNNSLIAHGMNTSGHTPGTATFMAPQVGLSNGTANTTGGDTALDILSLYARPNLSYQPQEQ